MARRLEIDNPSNLHTIDYRQLNDLQTDFKRITPEKLERLKKVITLNGWYFPVFVWFNNAEGNHTAWTIDGHQRLKALKSLTEDGWEIPPIPYVMISARDKKDAARKLLYFNARYGDLNPTTSFFEDFDLKVDDFGLEFDDIFTGFEPPVVENLEEQDKNRVEPKAGPTKIIAIGTTSGFCAKDKVNNLEASLDRLYDIKGDDRWAGKFADWLQEKLDQAVDSYFNVGREEENAGN